jgi:hypothetical protein
MTNMNQPLYSYAHRGNLWAVLKWEYLPNGSTATVVQYFINKQDAMKTADNLNKSSKE